MPTTWGYLKRKVLLCYSNALDNHVWVPYRADAIPTQLDRTTTAPESTRGEGRGVAGLRFGPSLPDGMFSVRET